MKIKNSNVIKIMQTIIFLTIFIYFKLCTLSSSAVEPHQVGPLSVNYIIVIKEITVLKTNRNQVFRRGCLFVDYRKETVGRRRARAFLCPSPSRRLHSHIAALRQERRSPIPLPHGPAPPLLCFAHRVLISSHSTTTAPRRVSISRSILNI